ncbi:carboxymuconolactone decarboxylase family protein [Chitinophaga ginsengisegetis]|uniref:carboxymuconolactone decarboxylase family protein n=1 Tax=Chitinophaga ginsengisegetis TaxID=393003 RepID=UPI000DBACB17|nr:carboxymuconolactone decarboxylase family protein [Chitinophaga ginsengisegetis]MDR6569178.1 AhpD family alkylhydroperoxidase [Chitinophaga ginsengisegetis]MDR6648792.1 AhpD family alkylhydroperoxidase [Chitinophaga ginsengisegetis]MDR6655260.1 AhpD family alkylhydroperoxidase [Chitinophaga ginsengisegetis]
MEARMDIYKLLPGAYKAMMGLQAFVNECGLDKTLTELIKIRASQINGCAFCLNMHTKEARQMGETEQRIYGLSAWEEAPYYTDKERAALALTEAVTLVSATRVPDEVYKAAQAVFTQQEIAIITMAIVAINSWNRIAITSRTLPQG